MATSSPLDTLNTSKLCVRMSDDGHFLLFNPSHPSCYNTWNGKPLKLGDCTLKAFLFKSHEGTLYGLVSSTWDNTPERNDEWALDPETEVCIFPPSTHLELAA